MNPDENKQIIRNSIKTVWIDQEIDALPIFWTADCINHAIRRKERTIAGWQFFGLTMSSSARFFPHSRTCI